MAGVVPDARSIVTAPLPVARGLGFGELATVVAADALVRRAWAVGRAAELVVPTLTGDLAGQHAFDLQLAREGHDRSTLRGDDLAARRAAFEEDRRVLAGELFVRLSVTADLGAATTATPAVARAACIAFVRLFEAGVIEETDHVVATCPRCHSAVDAVDTVAGELESERLTLRLTAANGVDVDVALCAPELLPGAVAVAVPEGSAVAGSSVVVPIADREVPVVADPFHEVAAVVIPAHDGGDHELARSQGLVPITVLDGEGTVVTPGPLAGLGRYAARTAARSLLDAEGALVAAEPALEPVWRCGCCGTVLVPQLGRHWFLRAADLEVAAADAVRNGLLSFSPADARDVFLGGAGVRPDWCLSTSVVSGVPVPASVCLDCGKVTVDVDPASSCGKCMGVLVAQPLSLDARFVAAVWASVAGGWPDRGRTGATPDESMVVVSAADLAGWVLPAVALGLRLAGEAPFASVVVHPWPAPDDAGLEGLDVAALLGDDADPRVVRLALVAGATDLEAASTAVAALDAPSSAETAGSDAQHPAAAAAAAADGVAALDAGSPAQAAGLLASALAAGVPPEAADRVRALALPILGDART